MGWNERAIVERAKNIIESRRTQEAAQNAGVWLPDNASRVHLGSNCSTPLVFLEYDVTWVNENNQDVVRHEMVPITHKEAEKLMMAGISIAPVSRPGGRIIPRLTQKVKSI